MKRSAPLQRRTPLQNRKPMQQGKPLARSAPVKQRRATPRRRSRDEEHGIAWADVRRAIFVRCGGRCEGCGQPFTSDTPLEGHHRRTRRFGPDCPCNALALCGECHHGPTVHGGPELARELGRIIRREDATPPSTLPVEIHGRGLVLLACDGTISSA